MKKKILFFTGAGISAESGLDTFRRSDNALWDNYSVDEVATLSGWKKDKDKVLNFYNKRRAELNNVEPNLAHQLIAKLEEFYEVTIITQNVDNLHERAGSTNILHLHGELLKSRSTLDSNIIYECIGNINIGDKCEKGSQLRPHITLFGEDLDMSIYNEAKQYASNCDYCIVIGSSMKVMPASMIPYYVTIGKPVYYIDPGDAEFDYYIKNFTHIKEYATSGMQKIFKILKDEL